MSTSSLCFVKRVVVLVDLHTQCLTAYSCDNHGAHVLDLGMSFCPSHSGNHSEWKWKYMKRAENSRYLLGCLRSFVAIFEGHKKMSWQYDCTVNEVQETSWLVVLLVLALLKALTSPVQLVQGLIKCVQKKHLFCKSGLYTPQLFWGVKAVSLSLLLNGRPTQC